jgi:hypothetical protein
MLYIETMTTTEAHKAICEFEAQKAKYARQSKHSPRTTRTSTRGSDDTNNQIDIRKIQSGADVRGTVMLRNIPNRMNCVSAFNAFAGCSFFAGLD